MAALRRRSPLRTAIWAVLVVLLLGVAVYVLVQSLRP